MVFGSDQELLKKIVTWKRFIDNVFMLFRGSESECENLVNWLNGLLPGVVKFKYEYIPTINKKSRKKLGVSATTTGEVGAVNTSISPYN